MKDLRYGNGGGLLMNLKCPKCGHKLDSFSMEISAPDFRWVSKGEKGPGRHEPVVDEFVEGRFRGPAKEAREKLFWCLGIPVGLILLFLAWVYWGVA